MSLFIRPLRASCTVALLLPAFLAGCAGDSQPTKFAPLRYDYLSVLHLNAASLAIEDNTQQNPLPGDISSNAPTPPAQALRQMAQDRLAASGSSGTAKFVIDRASIFHSAGGVLSGQMAVHLVLLNSGGTQAARAEAHVSQTMHPDLSKGDADSPANLYELTNDMMQRMNVEFEYQVRNTMKNWLVDAGGTPLGSAIQSQSLDAPGSKSQTVAAPDVTAPAVAAPAITTPTITTPAITTPVVPANEPAAPPPPPAQSSEPDPVFPAGEDDGTSSPSAPSRGISPKPGVLQLPKH